MNFRKNVVSAAVVATVAAVSLSNVASANTDRVVGGAPILIDQAPSIVAMIDAAGFDNTGSYNLSQFCGGTLIAENWVMTAAHCVDFGGGAIDPSDLRILANSHDLNNPTQDAVNVSQIIVHPDYDPFSSSSDIALVQLASSTGATPSPINITELEIDERVFVAGWGARQHTPDQGSFDFPAELQGVEVLALPADICNTLPAYAGQVDQTMVCAGFPQGGIDTCQGDSGGPLYRRATDGSLIVAGITSWGYGCALDGRPGVYGNVSFFADWIRANTGVGEQPPVVVEPPVVEPPVVEPPVVEPEVPVVVTENPDNGDVTVTIPGLALNGSGSGSISAWLISALAVFGLVRRRAAKS